jgi:hypothetical protein
MARRRREIGNDQFLKLDDFEAGETIFADAIYLGTGEGMHGLFYRFEQEGEVFCVGSTALGMMLENITEGEHIELQYNGKKPSKHKGRKPFHTFKMWQLEDEGDEPEVAKPAAAKPKPKPKPAAEDESDDEDEADEVVSAPVKRKPGRSNRTAVEAPKEKTKARAPKAVDEDLAALDDLE